MRRRAALALLLYGCGSVGASDGPGTLRVASRAGDGDRGLEEGLLQRYRDAHPGVPVVGRYAATEAGYRERLFASLGAGAPPDAFLLDAADVAALVDGGGGRVLDLAPYLSRVGADPRSFDATVLSMFRRGTAVYALPRGYSPVVLAYNKDLFDRAGLSYPTDDWTWDDFLHLAHQLTRDVDGDGRVDQWGTQVERAGAAWLPWLWSGGGDVLCPGGRRAAGCLDSPTSVAAIRWYAGLLTEEQVAPRSVSRLDWSGGDLGPFTTGRVAMLTVTHASVAQLRLDRGRAPRVGFVELPHRAGWPPATVVYATGYAIPRRAGRRKLSVELLVSLTDSVAQAARGEAGLDLPAATGAAQALAAGDTLGWETAFLRATAHARAPWAARVARWRDVERVLPDLVDRILAGADPEAAAHDVAHRIDRLLGVAPR